MLDCLLQTCCCCRFIDTYARLLDKLTVFVLLPWLGPVSGVQDREQLLQASTPAMAMGVAAPLIDMVLKIRTSVMKCTSATTNDSSVAPAGVIQHG